MRIRHRSKEKVSRVVSLRSPYSQEVREVREEGLVPGREESLGGGGRGDSVFVI